MITVFLVTLVVMLAGIAMISVRILLVPGGDFHGSCSSNNPLAKRDGDSGCICGRKPGEACPSAQEELPSDQDCD